MKRSLNADPFNAIARHPEVRPWLGFGMEDIDLAPVVSNTDNFCFLTEHEDGGYLVVKLLPCLYAAHTLAMPEARGRPMLACMRDGFAAMFLGTDAIEVVTTVPDGNEAGDRWAQVAGFRETFRREGFFPLMGQMVGASFRSLFYSDWVMKDPRHEKLGELVHERIEEFRGAKGAPADATQNKWLGATMAAAIEGNVTKAVGFYNRWAVQAGYDQARVVSINPPCLDIGTATLQLVSGRLDVLRA